MDRGEEDRDRMIIPEPILSPLGQTFFRFCYAWAAIRSKMWRYDVMKFCGGDRDKVSCITDGVLRIIEGPGRDNY